MRNKNYGQRDAGVKHRGRKRKRNAEKVLPICYKIVNSLLILGDKTTLSGLSSLFDRNV